MNEQQDNQLYSTVDQLTDNVNRRFGAGANMTGEVIMTLIVILSGVLSAIFFWKNSALIFAEINPPALRVALALIVGLVPAEGAFFGWKLIRQHKADMTKQQLRATTTGIITAVAASVFGTFALYVSSFAYVPEDIKAFDVWLVFIALAVPVMAQVSIYAWYAVNERGVVQNYAMARVSAIGFDAHMQAEVARIGAIVEGMDAALNQKLAEYGQITGAGEADRLLRNGSQELLNMGKPQSNEVPAALPQPPQTEQPRPQPQPHANGAPPSGDILTPFE